MATHTATYKGHTIVIKKSWFTSTKHLIVDGEIQDVSGMLLESNTIMWGRVKSGDGCGDIIKVRLTYRNLLSFFTTCWVFVNDTLIFKE